MEVIRKEERNVFRRLSSRSNRCVVVYDGNRCIAEHPERTHIQLRDEAFLRREIPKKEEKVADSIMGYLYCLVIELAFLQCGRLSLDHAS
jgi:hypothetical protein